MYPCTYRLRFKTRIDVLDSLTCISHLNLHVYSYNNGHDIAISFSWRVIFPPPTYLYLRNITRSTSTRPHRRKNTDRPRLKGHVSIAIGLACAFLPLTLESPLAVSGVSHAAKGDVLNGPAVNLAELVISARKRDIVRAGGAVYSHDGRQPPTISDDFTAAACA